jgi:hypothetical protein
MTAIEVCWRMFPPSGRRVPLECGIYTAGDCLMVRAHFIDDEGNCVLRFATKISLARGIAAIWKAETRMFGFTEGE